MHYIILTLNYNCVESGRLNLRKLPQYGSKRKCYFDRYFVDIGPKLSHIPYQDPSLTMKNKSKTEKNKYENFFARVFKIPKLSLNKKSGKNSDLCKMQIVVQQNANCRPAK